MLHREWPQICRWHRASGGHHSLRYRVRPSFTLTSKDKCQDSYPHTVLVTPVILCVRSVETKSHQKSMRFGVRIKKGNFGEYGGTAGTMACGSVWVRMPVHVAGCFDSLFCLWWTGNFAISRFHSIHLAMREFSFFTV